MGGGDHGSGSGGGETGAAAESQLSAGCSYGSAGSGFAVPSATSSSSWPRGPVNSGGEGVGENPMPNGSSAVFGARWSTLPAGTGDATVLTCAVGELPPVCCS